MALGCALTLLGGIALSPTAQAQVAVSASIESNQLFRGETISQDDPGATLAFSLDGPGGLFAGADISGAAGGQDPRVTSFSQYAGLALRSNRTSFEIGVVHRHYRETFDLDYNRDYFEGFVGISRGKTRARFYVSPDYFKPGGASYYAELNTRLLSVGKWSLEGHGGMTMVPQDVGTGNSGLRLYEDWSIDAVRNIGGFSLTAGVASSNYPVVGESGDLRFRVVIGRAF